MGKDIIDRFLTAANHLKRNNVGIGLLLFLNIYLSINAYMVDWDRLTVLPWYLLPVSPICTLFVPLLIVWLFIYKVKQKVHPVFTAFMFTALVLYGMMAFIYYPLVLAVDGFSIWVILVLLFVLGWSLQAFVIASELRELHHIAYLVIAGYFFLKAYTDTFLNTFEDIDYWSKGVVGYLPVFTTSFLLLLGIALWAAWRIGENNGKDTNASNN